jgi:polyphenol oxidase
MTIRPEGLRGALFGSARDGDGRSDDRSRLDLAARADMPAVWAWVRQVHGTAVIEADEPGRRGDADALFTSTPGVALVVGTADCLPVVLEGDRGVGIAHAGWRGAAGGVVVALRAAMEGAGIEVRRAAVGPGIGPCCFEVGPEVLERFPRHVTATTWGTPSVDLPAVVAEQLAGLEVTITRACTFTDERYHSHRRNATPHRQVSAAWLPG